MRINDWAQLRGVPRGKPEGSQASARISNMRMHDEPKDAVIIKLSSEPALKAELERGLGAFQHSMGRDVIVDFSSVETVTSASRTRLLQLQSMV